MSVNTNHILVIAPRKGMSISHLMETRGLLLSKSGEVRLSSSKVGRRSVLVKPSLKPGVTLTKGVGFSEGNKLSVGNNLNVSGNSSFTGNLAVNGNLSLNGES
jgi:hypothetical protein